MSTSLEHTHAHEVDPHFPAARARAGVLMLILSDALSVIAVLAAGGYLHALNTENQYLAADKDFAPAFLPGLLVGIVLVLSGLSYYWWERKARANGGSGPLLALILANVFMIAITVGQVWIARTLIYNAIPYQAYDSLVTLLTWNSAVHFLLAAIIGLLTLGRALRGRLAGREYIAEVVGYWWYYTVVASLLMWLYAMVIR
ncbi:MAG TPA: hypothetical protein VKR06_22730 [Ktedonosporobacter sp.]|nr:hypothetical protein [Ktedonosporobacter sp.]